MFNTVLLITLLLKVACTEDAVTMYGPSGDVNCCGVCYNIRPMNMNFSVCTWKDLPQMAARRYYNLYCTVT